MLIPSSKFLVWFYSLCYFGSGQWRSSVVYKCYYCQLKPVSELGEAVSEGGLTHCILCGMLITCCSHSSIILFPFIVPLQKVLRRINTNTSNFIINAGCWQHCQFLTFCLMHWFLFFRVIFLFILNWIYWGGTGSQNQTGFDVQLNKTPFAHCIGYSVPKVKSLFISICSSFDFCYLAPPSFPLATSTLLSVFYI